MMVKQANVSGSITVSLGRPCGAEAGYGSTRWLLIEHEVGLISTG